MRATQIQQKVTVLNFMGAMLGGESTTLLPKQIDTSFNFDLDRMKKAVNAKSHTMPDTINGFDEFTAWR